MSFFTDIVGAVAGPLLGGIIGSEASDDAADAQREGSAAAIAEQRRVTDLLLRLQDPSRQLGHQAMGDLASLYGYSMPGFQNANSLLTPQQPQFLPGSSQNSGRMGMIDNLVGRNQQTNPAYGAGPGGAPASPELGPQAAGAPSLAGFFASPDYNFRRTEGTRGIEQSAAARGGAFSGNALRGLNEFNSNLASGEYGNYFNRLASLAGFGQTGTQQAGSALQSAGNNVSGLLQNQGDARASGIMGGANSIMGGINNGTSMWMLNRMLGGGSSGGFPGGYRGP